MISPLQAFEPCSSGMSELDLLPVRVRQPPGKGYSEARNHRVLEREVNDRHRRLRRAVGGDFPVFASGRDPGPALLFFYDRGRMDLSFGRNSVSACAASAGMRLRLY
jgi:hypothetical protein